MKNCTILNTVLLCLSAGMLQAQVNLQNTGTLFVTGSSDILYVNGSFTNTPTSALTNNGNLYVLQNLVNDQASMAVGTGTLYLNGSATQTFSGAQPFKTFNLVSNNGTGITLNNDLSVSGAHTFTAGVITTSTTPNYLMYEAGSSYTGDADARHVKGWVRKTGTTAFTFPVGNGTFERTINASNLAAASVFNATYAGPTTNTGNIAAPLISVDPNEYWIVNQLSGGSAKINLNWDNTKVAMPNYFLANIRASYYTGGYWAQAGSGATGNTLTTGAVSTNTISSFGSFVVGSISFVLPVNLVQFSAYNNNGNAVVSWTTTDEVNVSHYEIERSDDGLQFYSVGEVTAHNQADLQQYEFTDNKDLNEVTYYRLVSTDIGGQTKTSKIVTVRNNDLSAKYLAVANPAHSSIHVSAKNMSGMFEYRINTLAGQTIQQGTINIAASSTTEINLSSSVKSGLYILQIQKASYNFSQKVMVE